MRTLKLIKTLCLAAAIGISTNVLADNDRDTEGTIQSIDQQAKTFVVNDKTFHTDGRTDYDDDLNSFADLKTGQRIEVDYVMRDGKRYAKEIELDD